MQVPMIYVQTLALKHHKKGLLTKQPYQKRLWYLIMGFALNQHHMFFFFIVIVFFR